MSRNGWNSQKLCTWLGLSDLKQEGTFMVSSTGEEPGYTNWAAGNPDSYGGNEDCAQFYYYRDQWNDAPCDIRGGEDWKFVAVCEKI